MGSEIVGEGHAFLQGTSSLGSRAEGRVIIILIGLVKVTTVSRHELPTTAHLADMSCVRPFGTAIQLLMRTGERGNVLIAQSFVPCLSSLASTR